MATDCSSSNYAHGSTSNYVNRSTGDKTDYTGRSNYVFSSNKNIIDYTFIMAISPNYCLLGDPDYKAMLNMIKEYNGNALRVFAYAGWGDNFKYFPWNGNNYTDLKEAYFIQLKKFVKDANERGIIVIISLFQNNSGGGFENCTNVSRSVISPYIRRMVTELKEMDVIFETINEDANPDFNQYVVSEVKAVDPEAKCCTYKNHGLAEYSNYHLLRREYIGGGRIHSNDVSGYTKFYKDDDYYNVTKQAKEQGGHVEWLVYWPRKQNHALATVKDIMADYGEMLKRIKPLMTPPKNKSGVLKSKTE